MRQKLPLTYLFAYDSLEEFMNYKATVLVSMYSIHFMFNNTESINLLREIMFRYLHHNAVVYWLYYSGQRIFDLLDKGKKNYKNDKYFIDKKWKIGYEDP